MILSGTLGEKNRRRREQRGAKARREERDQIIVTGHRAGETNAQILEDIQRLTGKIASLRTVQYVLRKYGF